MSAMTTRNLPGDWRRRTGTKTDVHLFTARRNEQLPECGKRVPWGQSIKADGVPCYECLVAAISKAGSR